MRLMNLDRIAGLERSMKVHGQLQPVIARIYEGCIQMIDGFKRLYAAETLLMDSLECRLFEVDESQAKIMLLSYNQIENLDAYLGYSTQHAIKDELDRLELFLADRKDVMKNKERYFNFNNSIDAFSTASSDMSKTAYIISHYIFHGLIGLMKYNDGSILGFQDEKKHIPAILSLLFVSVSQPE